jgi:hypothetical protein
MTHEVSPKTEHQNLLTTLLRSAQMSCRVLGSSDFAIPLERIREQCGVERPKLLQPFSDEAVVTHGGFMIRYEPEYDRVQFKRIEPPIAGAPTLPLAPVAVAAVPVAMVRPTPKAADPSMSAEEVMALAKQEFATDPKIRSEFKNEARYTAWRKAEAAGRARILGRQKTVNS